MKFEGQHWLAEVEVAKHTFRYLNAELILLSVTFCHLYQKIELPPEDFGYIFVAILIGKLNVQKSAKKIVPLVTKLT